MDGDIADLPSLAVLKKQFNAFLIVDDAHGVGVIGNDGSGTASHYGLTDVIDLQVGTLSKALAAEGGYVAGKKILIDYLINRSRPFIFSTALAPATLAAANAALLLLQTQASKYLDSLRANSRLMRRLLLEGGLNVVEGITPIRYSPADSPSWRKPPSDNGYSCSLRRAVASGGSNNYCALAGTKTW